MKFSKSKFPFYRQLDSMDCGPTCLRMIAQYYGQYFSLETLREKTQIDKEGVSLLSISHAAEQLGYRSIGTLVTWDQLENEVMLPCIAHWNDNHFVVIYKINKNKVWIADPAKDIITYSKAEFLNRWLGISQNNVSKGILLLLYPTPAIYEVESDKKATSGLWYLLKYFKDYKALFLQLIIGLGVGTIIQLLFPFLTQSLVDIGINSHSLTLIELILLAQIFLFVGQAATDFLRSWILLHISARINIAIISEFLIKLMRLPVRFFETKMTGDILQRMNDHQRIENFLTSQTLTTLFSSLTLVIFSAVLGYYNLLIFLIFVVSGVIYVCWVVFFLKYRRKIDYLRFELAARNQGTVIQMIQGMQDIKLTNSEKQKRWGWENIQAQAFHIQIKSLSLTQLQDSGAFFLNQGKNILITFLSAVAVLKGELSLGAMLAIQYIIGQLNSPLQQLVTFVQSLQDAKISLERLNEIHKQEDEENQAKSYLSKLPDYEDLRLENVTFNYPGIGNEPILKNIDLTIPKGKTTAIVGMSGSGKTTIFKLLLRFYEPTSGVIKLGNHNLEDISHYTWRECTGSVMQDGYIFSDTIAHNIAVGEDFPDIKKIHQAIKLANLEEFIDNLPLSINTIIGAEGNGISQGQKQRILIARAVYKNPPFLFFDEATNALDANNERSIMENLNDFLKGRTAVIIAHRLSTIKNADNIIVLSNGSIAEQGCHEDLIGNQAQYYKLFTNQLDITYE